MASYTRMTPSSILIFLKAGVHTPLSMVTCHKILDLIKPEKPPFWDIKKRFQDYLLGIPYPDRFPMARSLPADTQLNWLREDEWTSIKRSVYPAIRFDDVINEKFKQQLAREKESERGCQCRRQPSCHWHSPDVRATSPLRG